MTSLKASTMVFSKILGYFSILLILFLSIAVVRISSESLCEELPVINNGVLEGDQQLQPPFKVNDTLIYKCNEYYKTEERFPKVTCVLNDSVANWTESACKRMTISCGDPGFISNADRVGLLFSFPHSIKYVCHEGYRMVGIDTKFCSRIGSWTPERVPYCEEILCPALGGTANGKVVHSNRRVGSTADYLCDRYYKLVGDSKRECLNNGSWSGNSPVCEKITCKAPDKFPNGRIIGKKDTVYNASDILIFRCNDGLTHSTSKCLENGEWNHPPPTCPGTIIEASSTTTQAPTTLSESFPIEEKTEGSPVIETSSTSTSAPTTLVPGDRKDEVTSCEDPGKIKNGDRAIVELHINSTVTYICDEGYEIRGKSSLLCLENGKWDLDKLPICVKPVSPVTIFSIVFGVIVLLILIGVGGFLWYRYKMKSIRGYGEKSKALTADATDIEEIAGLDREKKQIPVTVL